MVRRTTFLSNTDSSNINKRFAAAEARRVEELKVERNKVLESETPAWKLFNRAFDVLIPAIHLYTPEQISEGVMMDVVFGGGNRDVNSTLNKVHNRYLHVPEMAEVVIENNGNLDFRSTEDAADVYDLVMDHLESWLKTINESRINGITVPWVDLLTLDKFAAWVFPKARTAFGLDMSINTTNDKKSLLLQSMGVVERYNTEADRNGFINNVAKSHVSIFDEIDAGLLPKDLDYGL